MLSVDEAREQTRAIHRLQRERRTLEGLLAGKRREAIVALHQNAQRLLRPLAVVNPYAPELTFLDTQIRTRRDHEKYLTLIDALALLHQHQRPVQRASVDGRAVEYVEVELGDIETANRLAHEVLGRSLDELPPQTRRLLALLDELVSAECERLEMERSHFRFTRREVRAASGWGDTQLRLHLARLVSMEYVLVHQGGRGQSYVYELLYEARGEETQAALAGLIDVEALRVKQAGDTTQTTRGAEPTSRGPAPESAGATRPQRAPTAGGSRGEVSSTESATSTEKPTASPENAHLEAGETGTSHRKSERRTEVGPTPGLGLALETR